MSLVASDVKHKDAHRMADHHKRLPDNVPGEFFVNSACIDCDTCRQLAPATFVESGGLSVVRAQPRDPAERRRAFRALVACPTASIGGSDPGAARDAAADFPLQVEDEVYYCGFTSPKSFGGSSYFIRHADGNWLIDSPRYVEHLVRRFQHFGGIRFIFLTHRDDVADAARYARRFASRRIIHCEELRAQPGAEIVLDSFDPVPLAPGFLAVPTPGHTRGHCALLHRDRFLFTGDHLWWSRDRQALHASRAVCWHSWTRQVASVEILRRYSFEWVLPGHGERIRLPRDEMRRQLDALLRRLVPAAS